MKATYGPDRYLLLVVLLTALAWAPLFYPGLFQSHSGLLAVYDVAALHQTLQQTQFSPGWTPALSDGGPFPFYLAEAPVLLGVGPVEAVKLVLGASILGAGLTMYVLVRRLWGRRPALLAAMIYTYAPFFLATIYVRGDLADALAYALAPLVFWPACDALAGQRGVLIGLALALAALVWTQPGLALAMAALVAAYVLWRTIARRAGRTLLAAITALAAGGLLGLLLVVDLGRANRPSGARPPGGPPQPARAWSPPAGTGPASCRPARPSAG